MKLQWHTATTVVKYKGSVRSKWPRLISGQGQKPAVRYSDVSFHHSRATELCRCGTQIYTTSSDEACDG
jgi:hypothetical protein